MEHQQRGSLGEQVRGTVMDVQHPGAAGAPPRRPTVVDVSRRAAELGADLARVVVGAVPDAVPPAPSDRWVLFPTTTGGFVVGGTDHDGFAPFATFEDADDAARVLARWTVPLVAADLDRTAEQLAAAARGARRVLAGAGAVTGAEVPVGTPFEHRGSACGHLLQLYGTPGGGDGARQGFLLARALPRTCTADAAAGLVVGLDRVIAFYVDTGTLIPVALP